MLFQSELKVPVMEQPDMKGPFCRLLGEGLEPLFLKAYFVNPSYSGAPASPPENLRHDVA